jgi:hypothetical protein
VLLAPKAPFVILVLYLLIPICLVVVLVASHRLLLKTMPTFLAFMTGSSSRAYNSRAQSVQERDNPLVAS